MLLLGTCIFPAFSLTVVGRGHSRECNNLCIVCMFGDKTFKLNDTENVLPGRNGKVWFSYLISHQEQQ